jgi:hypothetical protein
MEGRTASGPSTKPAAGPQWRRPVIAALITVVLASLVILLGYERMRHDANHDAAKGGAASVKRAAASGRGSANGAPRRPPAGPGGASPSQ